MTDENRSRYSWFGVVLIGVFGGVLTEVLDPNSFLEYAQLVAGVAVVGLLAGGLALVFRRNGTHESD